MAAPQEDASYYLPDWEGKMEALAACGRCYGRYPKADIRAGNVPCPNGHASRAFQSERRA